MNKSKLAGWVLIVLFSMVQFSCKQGSKQKESEWENVKAETNEILQAEYDSVKQKIKDAMADLDDRMKTLEARMETEEARLSEKSWNCSRNWKIEKGNFRKSCSNWKKVRWKILKVSRKSSVTISRNWKKVLKLF